VVEPGDRAAVPGDNFGDLPEVFIGLPVALACRLRATMTVDHAWPTRPHAGIHLVAQTPLVGTLVFDGHLDLDDCTIPGHPAERQVHDGTQLVASVRRRHTVAAGVAALLAAKAAVGALKVDVNTVPPSNRPPKGGHHCWRQRPWQDRHQDRRRAYCPAVGSGTPA
jgi:hypothetical protein